MMDGGDEVDGDYVGDDDDDDGGDVLFCFVL